MAETLDEASSDALDTIWSALVKELRHKLQRLESEGALQNPQVTEPLRNELIATIEGGFLSVWLNTDLGTASWNLIAPDDACEPWSMSSDGIATLGGKQMTVQQVADAFASILTGQYQ